MSRSATGMTCIAIGPAAYRAVVASLPPEAKLYAPERNRCGDYLIHVERVWLDLLAAQRRPDECYSDVILRHAPETSAFRGDQND